MERFKIGLPDEESIIVKNTFIIDQIVPICIRKMKDEIYTILFLANQDSTETSIFLQMALKSSDKRDEDFFSNHILNLDNITKDKDRLSFYVEATKDVSNDSLYSCDFNMIEVDTKPYFKATGARAIDELHSAIIDLLITRDNFIKLNLFFIRFMNYDISAETVFINHKLHNIKFSTINHVKLDGSATDISSRIVCNHYTCGNGPELYKFNFISRKIPDRKLINPMSPEPYSIFYSEDFTITDMIYEPYKDCLYVIYEVRSEINNMYKETKALIFNKEFYNKTNLLDVEKIYK